MYLLFHVTKEVFRLCFNMEIRNRIHIYSLLVMFMYRKLRNRSERKTNEIENVMFYNLQ